MRGLLIIVGAIVWAGISLFVFESLVWGWFSNVPDYMLGVGIVYGLLCGAAGAVVGMRE